MTATEQRRSACGWHYTLRRSRRARKLRLRYCRDEGLSVVVPSRVSVAEAEVFLLSQHDWVQRLHDADPSGLDQPRSAPECPERVDLAATCESFCVPPDCDALKLQRLVHARARSELPPWVARCSEQCGLWGERVSVRDQRSRWGSFSSRGTISLNWRLLLLPADMVDYVVLHELAHSRVMNHSPSFWDVLESICPNARERDRSFDRRAAQYVGSWARYRRTS